MGKSFCFNDTASTAIYTYGDTLSPHDALPSFHRAVELSVRVGYGTDAGVYPHGFNERQFRNMVKYGMTPMQAIQAARTEEHTSELQSLMRISYAVFCLKKK